MVSSWRCNAALTGGTGASAPATLALQASETRRGVCSWRSERVLGIASTSQENSAVLPLSPSALLGRNMSLKSSAYSGMPGMASCTTVLSGGNRLLPSLSGARSLSARGAAVTIAKTLSMICSSSVPPVSGVSGLLNSLCQAVRVEVGQ